MNDVSLTAYPASFYLALHTGIDGDLELYRSLCAGAREVLELGCGDGRVLAELAGPSRQLYGLDQDPEMLTLARRRLGAQGIQAELFHADMCSFTLPRTFDRILIPFNGLFCLQGDEQKLASFQAVAKHLEPEGRFLFDVYDTESLEAQAEDVEEEPDIDEAEALTDVEVSKVRYSVSETNVWWPSLRRLEARYEYLPLEDAEGKTHGEASHCYSILHSYADEETLVGLLEQAGFEVETTRLEPEDEEAADQIVFEARLA